jgi:hypothetical protein
MTESGEHGLLASTPLDLRETHEQGT